MAEMIYTMINPKILQNRLYEPSIEKGFEGLVESIKQDGIKSPLVVPCNNGKIHNEAFDGNHRLAISLTLGLDEIPVVLFSIHHKTGFEGKPITDVDDLIEIFGENIKNEPVYESVSNTIRRIRRQNNYPPDPLKNSSSIGD